MENETVETRAPPPWLEKPSYWETVVSGRRPSTRQILAEWFDAVDLRQGRTRIVPALFALHHLVTGGIFVYFVTHHLSVLSVVVLNVIGCTLGTFHNTVWYHRYCTHQVFKFRSIWFARFFLWLNPLGFREENYVVPHRIHHALTDAPGDPYGPHLGWLGNYLSIESTQKMNRAITREQYARLVKSLSHIGIVPSSYEAFQRTGSVEIIWLFALRTLLANVLWAWVAYAIAGVTGILGWYAGMFLFMLVIRDFNFRGHAGLLGLKAEGEPLNNPIYGLIAGEWHKNHHAFPGMARNGLAWWQLDVPYLAIRLLHALGIVAHLNEPGPHAFKTQVERFGRRAPVPRV
jgi:fatty-acid desaturase